MQEYNKDAFTVDVVHVPVHSCSNSSKTGGKAGCCEVWVLALLFTVETVHAKRSNATFTSHTIH